MWVAVNNDGTYKCFNNRPKRYDTYWVDYTYSYKDYGIKISPSNLAPRFWDMTLEDEPVNISEKQSM